MGHYRSNLRDLEFNLFEVFGAAEHLGVGPFEQLDVETARSVLQEVEHLATTELAASFASADRNPPVFDPATHSATLPEDFKKSYRQLLDGEWYRLELPLEMGGYGAPRALIWAAAELMMGANPAAYIYMTCGAFGHLLHQMGTPAQRELASHLVEKQWGATMVLTEPDAGSDVGAGRTTAAQQPDGTWQINGVKRFITSGEHDLAENIIHFVLARPEGAGPGTKGLSMFVVPKFLVNPDGSLGERNGVYATNVEHKMGLKASTTCELTFGAEQPAVGYLVGDVHDGIRQMFQVIEHARMLVGTKAIATLSTGYLNALEYAKTRVQGPDLPQQLDKTAPRVPIIHHPDVRRSLLRQKSYAEGLRALVMWTAAIQDEVALAVHEHDEARAQRLRRRNDLLLPLVKGCGSERSYELLGAESLQTFGGSGYLSDYPIEQYIRDSKIDTLYEGTTAIQGLDLFFRKIVRDDGAALQEIATELAAVATGASRDPRLAAASTAVLRAAGDVGQMVAVLTGWLQASQTEPREIYKVGLNTTRLLLSLGDVVVAGLLLRQATVALAALDAGSANAADQAFYQGKVAAATFFASTVLPQVTAERKVCENTTLAAMDLDETAF